MVKIDQNTEKSPGDLRKLLTNPGAKKFTRSKKIKRLILLILLIKINTTIILIDTTNKKPNNNNNFGEVLHFRIFSLLLT